MQGLVSRIVEEVRRFVYRGSEGAPAARAQLMRRARGFGLVAQGICFVGGLVSGSLYGAASSLAVMCVIGLCLRLCRLDHGRLAALAVNLAIGTLIGANLLLALCVGGGANPNVVTFPILCIFATAYIAGPRPAAVWAAASVVGMALVVFDAPLPAPAPGIYEAGRAVLVGQQALVLLSALALASVARRFEDRQSAQLEYLARHDPLTGLLNRRELEARIDASMARAARYGWTIALLFVDLDHFKRVNDERGHHAGDAVLQAVAARIRQVTRSTDAAARMGGDEFVVLLEAISEVKNAEVYARRLRSIISAPIPLPSGELRVTASIGVVTRSGEGEEAGALLRAADAAMYDAKRRGGDGIAVASGDAVHECTGDSPGVTATSA